MALYVPLGCHRGIYKNGGLKDKGEEGEADGDGDAAHSILENKEHLGEEGSLWADHPPGFQRW